MLGALGGRLVDKLKARGDRAFLTADNPGDEEPGTSCARCAPEREAPRRGVRMIRDRRAAIHAAVAGARSGDALVIADRGHETSVPIWKREAALDDRQVAGRAIEARSFRATA